MRKRRNEKKTPQTFDFILVDCDLDHSTLKMWWGQQPV